MEIIFLAIIAGLVLLVIFAAAKRKKIRDDAIKKTELFIMSVSSKDRLWQKDYLLATIKNTFNIYYSSWATFNPRAISGLVSENLLKITALEMLAVNKLNKTFKLNLKDDIEINIVDANETDNTNNGYFIAEIKYVSVSESPTKQRSFLRSSTYSTFNGIETIEYWRFNKSQNGWIFVEILGDYFSGINNSSQEESLSEFISKNGLFYTPDLGNIIIPENGNLFNNYYENQKIKSHLIGQNIDKVVEYYIFTGSYTTANHGSEGSNSHTTTKTFSVGQVILPKAYSRIIIDSNLGNDIYVNTAGDFEKIKTESIGFDNKFSVYRDKVDRINVLELLSPDFMERLMQINFPFYMEINNNVLYVAKSISLGDVFKAVKDAKQLKASGSLDSNNNVLSKNTADIFYEFDELSEVLNIAFETMKM